MQNDSLASRVFIDQVVSRNELESLTISDNKCSPLAYSLLAIFLVWGLLTLAQVNSATANKRTGVGADTGYWRLNTQASTHSTNVQFYGPSHQLLYEESLPGKWINLSHKNQKRFDQLLAQLVSKQLVMTRIKTQTLPADSEAVVAVSTTPTQASSVEYYTPQTTSYHIQASINVAGKLFLALDNPERLRYKVAVINHRDEAVYEEFTNHNRYRRKLDLSDLTGTTYQIVVRIANEHIVYQVVSQANDSLYLIRKLPTDNDQALTEPLATEDAQKTKTVTEL